MGFKELSEIIRKRHVFEKYLKQVAKHQNQENIGLSKILIISSSLTLRKTLAVKITYYLIISKLFELLVIMQRLTFPLTLINRAKKQQKNGVRT